MRKVELSGPSFGWKLVSLTIENWLPSIARWKVSATTRAPTPFSRPAFNSAEGVMEASAGGIFHATHPQHLLVFDEMRIARGRRRRSLR